MPTFTKRVFAIMVNNMQDKNNLFLTKHLLRTQAHTHILTCPNKHTHTHILTMKHTCTHIFSFNFLPNLESPIVLKAPPCSTAAEARALFSCTSPGSHWLLSKSQYYMEATSNQKRSWPPIDQVSGCWRLVCKMWPSLQIPNARHIRDKNLNNHSQA